MNQHIGFQSCLSKAVVNVLLTSVVIGPYTEYVRRSSDRINALSGQLRRYANVMQMLIRH